MAEHKWSLREYHEHAMQCADCAKLITLRHGKTTAARRQARKAYEAEIAAARMAAPGRTHAVLYRSAAWLAHWSGLYDEAIEAAEAGLAGEPGPTLKRELEDVLAAAQQEQAASGGGE